MPSGSGTTRITLAGVAILVSFITVVWTTSSNAVNWMTSPLLIVNKQKLSPVVAKIGTVFFTNYPFSFRFPAMGVAAAKMFPRLVLTDPGENPVYKETDLLIHNGLR